MVRSWYNGVMVVFVIALTLRRDSAAVETEKIIGADEFVIEEGSPLEIKCTSFNVTYIEYPNSESPINSSNVLIYEGVENGLYTILFHRLETDYWNTGLYGCPNSELEIISPRYYKAQQTFVYIYVESSLNVFVANYTFHSLRPYVGESIVIPCRPTSPNFTVELVNSDGSDARYGDRLWYNPRIGFTLSNLTLQDSTYMKCVIKQDGKEHEVSYHLNIGRKRNLNAPRIVDDNLHYITRGQTLHMNCTVDLNAEEKFVLYWNTTQQNDRIKNRTYFEKVGSIHHSTNELIIEDVRDEDAACYQCVITSFHDSKASEKCITVHDPQNKFIDLKIQGDKRHYQLNEGTDVKWVVYVHAFPEANLKWLNTEGKEIVANWDPTEKSKYSVRSSYNSTILKINDLKGSDMGTYTLQATNKYKTESVNFVLEVLVRPVAVLKLQPYYTPYKEQQIFCEVAAYPPPNISWSYRECPGYVSCEQSRFLEIKDVNKMKVMNDAKTSFISSVNVVIEMEEQITCTACNMIGCDTHMDNVLVSDGVGDFGIIEPKDPVIEGDDLQLICAAILLNYTNNFSWWYGNDTPIQPNNRVTITETKTLFTYRSILTIKNVTKADSMSYVCRNKEDMWYNLTVHDGEAPSFKFTSLNGSEATYDSAVQREPLLLQCFVEGSPKPKVTWYKDDAVLVIGDRTKCSNRGQELNINNIWAGDSGRYSCYVENRFGKLRAYQTIIVIDSRRSSKMQQVIVPIVVVLLVLSVILLIYCTIKVRRERKKRIEIFRNSGLMHFEDGAVECLNPNLPVDDQANLLPYDKRWEFPREKLKLGMQLGSGAFGVVMKAEAEGICDNEPVTTVAVKMVRNPADATYLAALATELKIMVHLGKHLNVVNLLGACTKNIMKGELLVIVEYCRFGNLHSYLQRHRSSFINQIDSVTGKFDPTIGVDHLIEQANVSSNNSVSDSSAIDSANNHQSTAMSSLEVNKSPDGCVSSNDSSQAGRVFRYRGDYKDRNLKPICTQDLLCWAFQVARGMEYLSQRKVLHADLAARNILLAEDNVVKICDFGLARTMYKDGNYKKKGDGLLPIKWMAIESLRDRIFSTESDVWSFGIVLWEFFTLARTPYAELEAERQFQKLDEGYRMEKPEYATTEVYNIMLNCWNAKPFLRPSFTQLVKNIGELLEEHVKSHYIGLNDPYLNMNTMILGETNYLQMLAAPNYEALSSPCPEYTNCPSSSPDTAYLCMSPTSPNGESGIFSPRPNEQGMHFVFPSPASDAEDAVEASPMLKKQEDDDPYLKPINVNERRAEFVRQMQAKKKETSARPMDRDSGYCNAPRNIPLIDLGEKKEDGSKKSGRDETSTDYPVKKDFARNIISTQDNYVDMPKQKSDLRYDMPDGFSNPSYAMMAINQEGD